jgi:predicted small metal-binding protein
MAVPVNHNALVYTQGYRYGLHIPGETAPTEAELFKKTASHAKSAHNIDPVPPDLKANIKKAIKNNSALFS